LFASDINLAERRLAPIRLLARPPPAINILSKHSAARLPAPKRPLQSQACGFAIRSFQIRIWFERLQSYPALRQAQKPPVEGYDRPRWFQL